MTDLTQRVADRYSKLANVDLRSLLHKPGEADEALRKAYLSLLSFKNGFDVMEEIPKTLLPYYNQTMLALGKIQDAQQPTYQLKMIAPRILR